MISSVADYHQIAEELGLTLGRVDITLGDARALPMPAQSMDGIVTSPPYSIALDYVANDAHALKALGHDLPDLRESFIGVRGRGMERIALYNADMRQSYGEMGRVLKPGGQAVIVIGNATFQGQETDTAGFTIECMESFGLKLMRSMDKIIFGLYNVMRKEKILIFQKAGKSPHGE